MAENGPTTSSRGAVIVNVDIGDITPQLDDQGVPRGNTTLEPVAVWFNREGNLSMEIEWVNEG